MLFGLTSGQRTDALVFKVNNRISHVQFVLSFPLTLLRLTKHHVSQNQFLSSEEYKKINLAECSCCSISMKTIALGGGKTYLSTLSFFYFLLICLSLFLILHQNNYSLLCFPSEICSQLLKNPSSCLLTQICHLLLVY